MQVFMDQGELTYFFYSLLGEPKRRKAILFQWHKLCPNEETSLRGIFRSFIHTLLFERTRFKLTQRALYVFGTDDHLPIMLNDLSPTERNFVNAIWKNKNILFDKREEHQTGLLVCTRSIFDLPGRPPYISKIWRRQLVRDFCCHVLSEKSLRPIAAWPLLLALQDLLVSVPGDPFVGALHYALQKKGNVRETLCWDNFVGDHNDVNV
jgi:hypothetical protein